MSKGMKNCPPGKSKEVYSKKVSKAEKKTDQKPSFMFKKKK